MGAKQALLRRVHPRARAIPVAVLAVALSTALSGCTTTVAGSPPAASRQPSPTATPATPASRQTTLTGFRLESPQYVAVNTAGDVYFIAGFPTG